MAHNDAAARARYVLRHPETVARVNARYTASAKGMATRARARAAWKARNADRVRGHNRVLRHVRAAVRDGLLIKGPCQECGATKVAGHHHKGYAPAHELDVVWLCSRHHAEAHRMDRAAT